MLRSLIYSRVTSQLRSSSLSSIGRSILFFDHLRPVKDVIEKLMKLSMINYGAPEKRHQKNYANFFSDLWVKIGFIAQNGNPRRIFSSILFLRKLSTVDFTRFRVAPVDFVSTWCQRFAHRSKPFFENEKK